MPENVICSCSDCKGRLIPAARARTHVRAQSRAHTFQAASTTSRHIHTTPCGRRAGSGQILITNPKPLAPPVPELIVPKHTFPEPVDRETLEQHRFLDGGGPDHQFFGSKLPNLGPSVHDPHALLGLVDHYENYNVAAIAATRPLTIHDALRNPPPPDRYEDEFMDIFRQVFDEEKFIEDNIDIDQPDPIDAQPDTSRDDSLNAPATLDDLLHEDNPDPFRPDLDGCSDPIDFHLPRIACHALLAILAFVVAFLNPSIEVPNITLKSANRALGIEFPIHILTVCPNCKEVYPGALSTPHACPRCGSALFDTDWTSRGNKQKERVPLLRYPYLSISEQLTSILAVPGTEEILDRWRQLPRKDGLYTDIFDGRICKGLKAHDGFHTYAATSPHPTHPAQPLFQSVTSLLSFEQSPDEIQRYLRPIISDLLRLWKEGVRIITPSHPNGRIVRVALVALVCDKPAAHKIAGFGSHSHTYFSTTTWVSTKDRGAPGSFERGAFPPRTDAEQRRLGEEYRKLANKTAHINFVKVNATRYTQLSCLPYFNLVDQVIIDPMHNLFLGLVNTHFYNIWIQSKILCPKHELLVLHKMLDDFVLPGTSGKLPKEIGIPAGGSLTADQWLLLSTVFSPIIIPQLWSACMPHDDDDNRLLINKRAKVIAKSLIAKKAKAQGQAEKARIAEEKKQEKAWIAEAKRAEKARIAEEKRADKAKIAEEKRIKKARIATEKKNGKRKAVTQDVDDMPLQIPPLPPGSFPVDTPSHATTNPLGPSTSEAPPLGAQPSGTGGRDMQDGEHDGDGDKDEGEFSLHPDDPKNFLKLCSALKLLTQCSLTDQDINKAEALLRDYCNELMTLYGQDVIKPNHYYAMDVADCSRNFGPLHDFWSFLFERLNKILKSYKTNNHANEFQRTCLAARITCSLKTSPPGSLQHDVATIMLKATNEERGTVAGLAALSHDLDNLDPDGKRYHASHETGSNRSSLIEVICTDVTGTLSHRCGELLEIFEYKHTKEGIGLWFGRMRWFKEWNGDREDIWNEYKSLDVRLWSLEEYNTSIPPLIDLESIKGHLGRTVVTINEGGIKVWATIALKKTRN
ncbi:hypothetical protein BD779DRAFT_1470716 [Infundibulicybe gibba]|nr:hypothetical protein BD779DRAFT_1470716 [Infundibulicybe gibba]